MAIAKIKNDVLQIRLSKDGRWQAHLYSGQYKSYFVMPKATNTCKLTCVKIAIAFLNKYQITN